MVLYISYYLLRAVDISSKEWTSARVKMLGDFSSKRDAIILSGKLRQIKYSPNQIGERNSAHMILRLPKNFKLPWNIVTDEILRADGKILQEASGFAAARFSAEVKKVIAASAGSVEAEALTVSVSIEGILKEEFRYLVEMDQIIEKIIEVIEQAKELISNSKLEEKTKNRFYGSLDAIKTPNALEIFIKLNKNGVIDESLIKAWKKMRNQAAHSTNYDSSKIDSIYKKVNSIQFIYCSTC